jgi:hypothetical protein
MFGQSSSDPQSLRRVYEERNTYRLSRLLKTSAEVQRKESGLLRKPDYPKHCLEDPQFHRTSAADNKLSWKGQ